MKYGTPSEFKALRTTIGRTAVELAELLGVASETISRWENGHTHIPKCVWFVIELLAQDKTGEYATLLSKMGGDTCKPRATKKC